MVRERAGNGVRPLPVANVVCRPCNAQLPDPVRLRAPNYESIVEVIDPKARRIVFSLESPTQRPNLSLQERGRATGAQLTDLPDPAPWFAQVKGELVRYLRDDGIELTATLYLPPGYDKARDGRSGPCFAVSLSPSAFRFSSFVFTLATSGQVAPPSTTLFDVSRY
jgi:hypothetical protein